MNPQRTAALASVLAMHALAAAALLSYGPTRSTLLAAAPIMVDLITPPKAVPVPQMVRPITPRPKPRPVVKPKPERPAPVEVAPAPEVAPPPVATTPATTTPAAPPTPLEPTPAPAAPAPVVAVSPPLFNADYLDNPAPRYPPLSRRVGEQGRVLLRVLVDPAGSAREIEVRASSGHARLDDAARDAVRQWRFVPAKRGQEPVAAWVLVPVSFRLDG